MAIGLKVVLAAAKAVAETLVVRLATLPLTVCGFVAVPLAILTGYPQPDITQSRIIYSAPKWLWLWGNQQEGYDAPLSVALHPRLPTFLRRFLWAAWRNPVSNLRFLGLFKPKAPVVVVAEGDNWKITRSGGLYLWFWDRPAKRRFTKFGARMGMDWSVYGANFAFRVNGRY